MDTSRFDSLPPDAFSSPEILEQLKLEEVEYDFVVVGGGLAGVCAAIAAARLGIKTAIVQDRPVFGGNSSSEIRVTPVGAGRQNPWADETGIIDELLVEDRKSNHAHSNSLWDLVLYDTVYRTENLDAYLNTTVRLVRMAAKDRIDAAIGMQMGTERNIAFRARYFLDASGDGLFAATAGAAYRFGREGRAEFGESLAPEEPDGYTLPSTLLLISRDLGRPVPFEPPPWIETFPDDASLPHRSHKSYNFGFWWMELGGKTHHTIRDNEEIRHELLRHLLGVWDHIKNQDDHGAQNHALEWFGWVPGKRESRRFEGDYILTENDLRQHRLFPDRVAYGGWFLDEHAIDGILNRQAQPGNRDGDPDWTEKYALVPYSIPLRSLYSRNIRNLFFAGRNISASHMAHSSTRVMKTCAVIGQAAGTAASLCVSESIDPADLSERQVATIQQRLLRQGCYIPSLRNEDPDDLARSANVTASSTAPLAFPVGGQRIELDWPCGQIFPLSGSDLSAVSLHLASEREDAAALRVALRRAPDVWTFAPGEPIACAEAIVPPNETGWVRFALDASVEPDGLYWIEVSAQPGIFWSYNVDKHLIPVGTTSARSRPGSGHWRTYEGGDTTGSFALSVEPEHHPYPARNVVSGVTRPETWSSIWISDPAAPLPQCLDLRWSQPVTFNTVEITFDTNTTMIATKTPPLFRYPECVRDYRLEIANGDWKPIVEITGNYQRRRVHRFDTVTSDGLRLATLATNGGPSARVYEVRVYHEKLPPAVNAG